MRLNRDAVIAIVLLAFVGVMAMESFNIRRTAFSTLPAATWPRLVLGGLAILTLVYLVQALRGRIAPAELDTIEDGAAPGLAAAWRRHGNALMVFAAFLAFLLAMPLLGMLVGGIAFVFASLCLIGERTARAIGIHAAVAVLAVGGMWSVFTFGLGVFLPSGSLVPIR